MSALAKTPFVLGTAGLQNAMAKNPFTQGYASGMKGVTGDSGDLKQQNFMKGVRRLAGLETSQPPDTQSLSSVASKGWQKQKDKDNPPPPPPLRDSSTFSKMPSGFSGANRPSGMNTYTANKDDYKKNSDSGGSNSSGSTQNNGAQPVIQTPGSKETTKTKESICRQDNAHTKDRENKHTATKESQQVPGQNTAEKAASAQATQMPQSGQTVTQQTGMQAIQTAPQTRDIQGTNVADNASKVTQQVHSKDASVQATMPQTQTAHVPQSGTLSTPAKPESSSIAPNVGTASQQTSVQAASPSPQVQSAQGMNAANSVYIPVGGDATNDSSNVKSGSTISDKGDYKKKK